nr:ribosomal L7Ae/L30e/S12e/Gadd45 family protein [Desulfonispora thiosulfatigenes]
MGIKQTTKALQKDQVKTLYIAIDAETKTLGLIEEKAKEKGIQIIEVPSMKELGKAFGIDVGSACAAILKDL